MTNPLTRILPAARQRIERLSRRDMLIMGASAVVMKAADVAFDKLVVDPAVEAAATPMDPVPHMRVELGLREFDRLASEDQKAALHALTIGSDLPDSAVGRCSVIEERDGDMWVVSQGKEAGAILWGRPMVGRMADRPDRMFGRWRAECVRAAGLRAEPTFELVRAVANGNPHRYTALIVPGRQITIVTAPEPATPRPAARSTPPTTPRYT